MPEFGHLRSLVISLPSFQKSREDYSKDEGDLADIVAQDHLRAERDYLESVIDTSARKFSMVDANRFVYLTPYAMHANTYLPLMAVEADYSSAARPTVAIHSLLYMRSLTNPGEIRCISYRFDVPNRTVGDHSFFHMQFAWGANEGKKKRTSPERWISKKDPGIPIDATTPVEMLLSSIISFRNNHINFKTLTDRWTQEGIPITTMLTPMALTRWKAPWITPPATVAASKIAKVSRRTRP